MAKLRDSRGGAYESRGRFYMRVTTAPQTRPAKLLPWCTSLEDAQARANVTQALVNRLRVVDHTTFIENLVKAAAEAGEAEMAELDRIVAGIEGGRVVADATKGKPVEGPITFRKFAERWTSGELHRLYPDHIQEKRTADDDEMRLGKWVYPVVEGVALASFTLAHAQEIMRRLPREKSASTRRHVAQLLVRVLNLAVYPCQEIKATPLPRGFLPKLGPRKALAYLYPDEDAQLMASASQPDSGAPLVPLVHRLLYGFLAREGMRSDEAQKLQWRDLDLARGTVRLDENKTDDPRGPWNLDPGVAAALIVWKTMVPKTGLDDLVFPNLTKPYNLAEMLRDHLKAAKVVRPELFERSKARRQIRLHDLRATFVTLALANGRTETWVMDRTGHTTSGQLNNYRRAARTVEELDLGWLSPLCDAIPEIAARAAVIAAAERGGYVVESDARTLTKMASSQRFRRRDSNSDKRNQNPLSCH